ncbi:DUF221-domain-containing protein [Rickenella mellea]|uniref:DUF221-domain-containing protein n=1 Tax=Rickenella mellea TaxID=50990 RepID=A0A4Y7Q800_9AGAM|nr:DUF221-domain-containing protein [Rickenella mellea]
MSQLPDDLLNENSRTIAPKAVAVQAGLMTAVSLVTIIFFNVLRPHNKVVYEPKTKYHVDGKVPPKISDSMFGWLSPLIHVKEPELLDKVGLDAVAFLRFLRLCRWLFTSIAAVACGILLPINLIYNLRNVDIKNRDVLSMLTIRDVSGLLLYAHVAGSYVITLLVMVFVWFHWKAMLHLRHSWFRSPEYVDSFYARTLMVLHVPKKYQSDGGLRAIFDSVQMPYPTTSVHIGHRVGRLPELIEYHNDAVRELEEILVRYLKGGRIGKARPTLRRGGFLGIGGQKVDAIDFYTNKLKNAEAAINDYRQTIDTHKPENYGFASMAAVPYAHIAAQLLMNKHPQGTDIGLAPNPKDILWNNLNLSDGAVARRRLLGWIYLGVVCFFNTVPLLIVSFLANLSSLTVYVGFLASWANKSHATFAIASGVLPPAVSAAFGYVLPILMRRLSKYQGATTRSRLDRAVVARYFAFLMISQLFIFTLIGVIFLSVEQIVKQIGKQSFGQILKNLHKLPGQINSTYIDQSNYWLTFFPLRGFLVIFDLAQILNLCWIWLKTRLFGRTIRDYREWTQPPMFEYAIYYANILFMVAVGMVFAPLAPLVVGAAAVVFWLSSFVYKYQLMFVFVTKVETGGRLWNVAINRLLVTVIFMQLLMTLTIGLQRGFKSFEWVSCIPPILIIAIFKGYIDRQFNKPFRYFTPTEAEIGKAIVHSSDARGNRLEKRFGHPALHSDLFTPMLHAKMMPLLREVYHGRIESDKGMLGGQRTSAQIIPGGIKIAAVSQNELDLDVALYQRDRGELDWDQRSMVSSHLLGDHLSQGGRASPAPRPAGYGAYLAGGPGAASDIELSRFDSRIDQVPLLSGAAQQTPPQSQTPYQHQRGGSGYFDAQSTYSGAQSTQSNTSLPPYSYATPGGGGGLYPPAPQRQYAPQQQWQGGGEQRPHPSRQASGYSDVSSAPSRGAGGNMAGRGTYRGTGY